ncbi:MAG: copper transport protein [Actinomycetota bacterium]|jgi:methionine-rich copper-binding protein CopC|nr:copper transport protein [Actinomycetota bacterium]
MLRSRPRIRARAPLRILAAVAVAVGALLVAPSPATAHTDVQSTSPANGAELASAPGAVTVTFGEKVVPTGSDTRIIDGQGRVVPARVTARGRTVTITPRSPLPRGRYAAAWHVRSADGHTVEGAISFTVGTPNVPGPEVAIAAKPRVPTTLSASRPGSRTLAFTTKARSGEVVWTSADLPEPLVWEIDGDGTTATATGVLPTAGRWTFEATLELPGISVVIVTGSVTLKG